MYLFSRVLYILTVYVVKRTLEGMCYKFVENMWSMQGQLEEFTPQQRQ